MKFKACFLFFVSFCFAGVIISPQDLPQNARDFLAQNFKAQIGLAQRDKKGYEVYLNDGTELEFFLDGSWKEIENEFLPLNIEILPSHIAQILKIEFPNARIKELKKKMHFYKIEFDNDYEILIDFNGTILKKKFKD